jgi:hypothetical protein
LEKMMMRNSEYWESSAAVAASSSSSHIECENQQVKSSVYFLISSQQQFPFISLPIPHSIRANLLVCLRFNIFFSSLSYLVPIFRSLFLDSVTSAYVVAAALEELEEGKPKNLCSSTDYVFVLLME